MLQVFLLGLVACHLTSFKAAAFGISVDFGWGRDRHSHGDFSSNLLQQIAKRRDENVVCSPISAKIALTMAMLGSESTTRQQIESALGISSSSYRGNTDYLDNIRSTINSFDNYEEVTLRMASKIFVDRRFPFEDDFASSLDNYLRSEGQYLDFEDRDESCDIINQWCAAQTNNRLERIIDPADIDDQIGFVMANAAYFLGSWEDPFPTQRTTWKRFWVHGTYPEDRLTMRKTGSYNYGELDGDFDATFVELPYRSRSEGDGVSMFIILPNERDGLERLTSNLGRITIDKLRNGDSRRVDVSLPKFTVESTIDLEKPLENLGVTDMFNRKADFRRISAIRGLRVDDMIQTVALDVNEGGSEAAGNGVGASPFDSEHYDFVDFTVDHPFVCMIVTETGVTLFSAIINSPYSPRADGNAQ